MKNIKNIAVLGSTGSIGTQTMDIIAEYPDKFYPYLLTANSNVDLLVSQAKRFLPKKVIIANTDYYNAVKEALADYPVEVYAGAEAIAEIVMDEPIDIVVTAMVGYNGLAPTINAIKANKIIALSNKETLVVAGSLIERLLAKSSAKIYPVDSEHSAIFQCLVGENHDRIEKLILTASGGPFRTKSIEELQYVTKAETLNHPNWKMGAKVTVDSATMMNKGFEIMEAKWLFDIDADRIEVVVHPQSIVHSMVEFVDGSIKAQIGVPDMHTPIRYALGYDDRLATPNCKLKVSDYSNLTFEAPDLVKFPMLAIAYEAIHRGGNIPCALNAANEIAVAEFLKEKIRYIDIPVVVEKALTKASFIEVPEYADFVNTNDEIRKYAASLIK